MSIAEGDQLANERVPGLSAEIRRGAPAEPLKHGLIFRLAAKPGAF